MNGMTDEFPVFECIGLKKGAGTNSQMARRVFSTIGS